MSPSGCTACKCARYVCTAIELTKKTTNACCGQRSVFLSSLLDITCNTTCDHMGVTTCAQATCAGSPEWVCRRSNYRKCILLQSAATPAPCRMTAGPSGRPQHHAMMHSSTHTYIIPQRGDRNRTGCHIWSVGSMWDVSECRGDLETSCFAANSSSRLAEPGATYCPLR